MSNTRYYGATLPGPPPVSQSIETTPKGVMSRKEIALRDLIVHCWVHSVHHNCGYDKMTAKQKALYDEVTAACRAYAEAAKAVHK